MAGTGWWEGRRHRGKGKRVVISPVRATGQGAGTVIRGSRGVVLGNSWGAAISLDDMSRGRAQLAGRSRPQLRPSGVTWPGSDSGKT